MPFGPLVGIVADNVEDVQWREGDLSWHEYKYFLQTIRDAIGCFILLAYDLAVFTENYERHP